MKNICFAFCIVTFLFVNHSFGSEAGMPQLNPEFWTSQIFWLLLIFSFLYLTIWKIFLPKITQNIENRKSRIVNDLDETEKLKEKAEKKLNEYNKIINDTKKEAKKIVEDSKKKLHRDIENKKQKISKEIEDEILIVEKEIRNLKKSSSSNISKISSEISAAMIIKIIDTEVNTSNVSAVVNDITKKEMEKYI